MLNALRNDAEIRDGAADPTQGDIGKIELLDDVEDDGFGGGFCANDERQSVLADFFFYEIHRLFERFGGFLKVDDLNAAAVCENKRPHLRIRFALFPAIKNTRFDHFAGGLGRIGLRLLAGFLSHHFFWHERKYSKRNQLGQGEWRKMVYYRKGRKTFENMNDTIRNIQGVAIVIAVLMLGIASLSYVNSYGQSIQP